MGGGGGGKKENLISFDLLVLTGHICAAIQFFCFFVVVFFACMCLQYGLSVCLRRI